MDNAERITEINNKIIELLNEVKRLKQEKLSIEQESINKYVNIGDCVKILSDDGLDDRYMLIKNIIQSENNLKITGPSFSFYLSDDDNDLGNDYINMTSWSYEYIDVKDIEEGIIQVVSKEELVAIYNEMAKKVFDSLFNINYKDKD